MSPDYWTNSLEYLLLEPEFRKLMNVVCAIQEVSSTYHAGIHAKFKSTYVFQPILILVSLVTILALVGFFLFHSGFPGVWYRGFWIHD